MRADLRPERVVAADEEYRELGLLGHGNGLLRSGLRRSGLTFSGCVLHRHPPLIVTKLDLLHCNSAALATSNDCVVTQARSSWKYGFREMAWITFWMQSRPKLESAQASICLR